MSPDLTTLGRYSIERVLGSGAMGLVYAASDPRLNRRVAIKTIRRGGLDPHTAREFSLRFVREAQAAARLSHPNIVQVHDFGEEGPVAYIVMELVEGRDLKSFLDANERFPVEETVRIMRELCDALSFAHGAGIVHRDVKPANVMVDAAKRVRLTDFGVARVEGGAGHATQGSFVGTPAYMSPEQVVGGEIDARSDVFSAGVVLYQLLTGKLPFDGAGAWSIAKKVIQDEPAPPSQVNPALDPAFDSIVMRALAKLPGERHASMRELSAALGRVLEPRGEEIVAQPRAAPVSEAEIEFWRSVKDDASPRGFALYLERYPEGLYAGIARHRIAMLAEQSGPPPVVVPFGDVPGRRRSFGELRLKAPGEPLLLPLQSVEISARVASFVAEVTLLQKFTNPFKEHLEAEYIFPLAGGCAVGRFELHVAGRIVVGRVEERQRARREYDRAIRDGKRAALLEEERSNVFTVKLGNLPPGEDATVLITYSERLEFFEDGASELRLPLVVAPRYAGGKAPDAARIAPPRLPAGFDPLVGLKIAVELAGGAFEELACAQHATRTSLASGAIRVQLAKAERLDRDFVLRWRVGGAAVTSSLRVYAAPDGQAYGILTLLPPRGAAKPGLPRDVVFALDRSGSMGGAKMASAARACATLLRTLGPRDRFAIQAFDDRVEWLQEGGRRLFAADEEGIQRGALYLRGIEARGGTELDAALGAAIALFADPAEEAPEGAGAPIVVLLTDGEVTDEASVLKRLEARLGNVRVFAVGIDTAVNDGFLRRVASVSGGTSAFVTPGSALQGALEAMAREIGTPLITDLEVDDLDSGLQAGSLTPMRMPDLFAGRAASVFLRLRGAGSLRVVGRFADGNAFDVRVAGEPVALPAVAHLWARSRVTDLEDRHRMAATRRPLVAGDSPEALEDEIVRLARAYMLLTRFTAFVAVDREVTNRDGTLRRIAQPAEHPAGWDDSDDNVMVGAMPAALSADIESASISLGSSSARVGSGEVELEFWKAIKDGNDPDDFELYVQQFPNGIYLALAKRKLAKLKGGAAPAPAGDEKQEAIEAARKEAEARAKLGEEKDRLELELARREVEYALAQLGEPVRKLEAELAKLEAELAAGRMPDAKALQDAIEQLAAAFRQLPDADRLPLIRGFLQTVPALLAALKSGKPAAELRPLVHAQLDALRAATAKA